MTNYEQRNRDRFERAATWVLTHPQEFPAESPAHEVATELKEIVAQMDAQGADQSENQGQASGATVTTDALIIECSNDIRRVAKTAKGLERKHPGIAREFALPDSWSWQTVANTSIAFCDNAQKYAASFERMNLSAQWWADLRADASEISARKTARQSDVDARIGNTASLGELMSQGVDVLDELEPMVENFLHDAHRSAEAEAFARAAQLDKSTRRGPDQPKPPQPPAA